MTILTPECTLSYPNLFKPRQVNNQGQPKYSAQLIFDAGTDISALQAAIDSAFVEKFPNGAPSNWRYPIVRGEDKYPEDLFYAGKLLMNVNANEEYPPTVVGPDRQPVIDKGQIYPGCRVVVGVRFYGYDNMGNKGVGCGVQAVMKVGDGERLDTSVDAETLFSGVPVHPGAPAPLQQQQPQQQQPQQQQQQQQQQQPQQHSQGTPDFT